MVICNSLKLMNFHTILIIQQNCALIGRRMHMDGIVMGIIHYNTLLVLLLGAPLILYDNMQQDRK
jgi:hypothetical protein